MTQKIFYLSLLLLFFQTTGIHAQFDTNVSKVGITAAPFLTIGVGARATSMGGAFVATASDASALFWNPSGIARIPHAEGIFSHINWIADINYDFIGFLLPAGRLGAFGASITTLSMDDMMVRTETEPQGTGEYFHSGDLCLALSYAVNLTDRFSIGFTGKYIRQQIWKETAQAMALDIGTLFTTNFHGMRIGAALSNFGSEMKMTGEDLVHYIDLDDQKLGNNDKIFAQLNTDSWPLPLNFQVGIAMELMQTSLHRVTFAIDAMQPTDNTESLNLGLEYGLREWFFLRAGYRNLFMRDSEEGLTLGVGTSLKHITRIPLRFDYAFADFGRLQNIQCITLALEL